MPPTDPDDPARSDNVVPLFGRGTTGPPSHNPDPRQSRTATILRNVGKSLGGAARTANMSSGFRASAVDLGTLQELLEAPLGHLTIDDVRERWKGELEPAAFRTVEQSVQRLKELRFDVRDTGVHVQLMTQDDRGYYRYAFDIFAGRRDRS